MISIIDCHAVCHMVKHALKRDEEFMQEYAEDGIVFGFLGKLLKFSKQFDADTYAFVWDSGKSKRKDDYPDYKNTEKPEWDEFNHLAFRQFGIIRDEVLPALGFQNSFYQEGYEGDDLIASIVKNTEENCRIMTLDNDLFQLLNGHVTMYHIRRRKLFTEEDFVQLNRIPPNWWPKVKALAGDTGKNFTGVSGVGVKTAIKYLKGELPFNKAHKEIIKKKQEKDLQIFEKLLTLPYEGTKDCFVQRDQLSFIDFHTVFSEWDFRYFLANDQMAEWVQNFQLN